MRLDPTLYSLCASIIERSLNEALQYDPGTRAKLNSLTNTTISLHVSDMDLCLSMRTTENKVLVGIKPLALSDDDKTDVKLTGNARNIASLLRADSKSLANTGVEVSGDLGRLQAIQSLAIAVDIDWQDALEQKLGSHIATPLSIFLKTAFDHTQNTYNTSKNQAKHFFINELKLVPEQIELEQFSTKVNDIRMRAERLEAQLNQLHRHLQNKRSTSE